MALHEINKLLHNKGNNYQNEETVYKIGENLCQLFPDQKLIFRIYRKLKKLSTKKQDNLINKWANELNTFQSRKYK
jgi:hypothetical protein